MNENLIEAVECEALYVDFMRFQQKRGHTPHTREKFVETVERQMTFSQLRNLLRVTMALKGKALNEPTKDFP